MPAWSPPALAAALFIALHYLLLRAASGRLEDRLGALVLEGSAALGIATSLLLGVRSAPVSTTRAGVADSRGGERPLGRGGERPPFRRPPARRPGRLDGDDRARGGAWP